MQRMKDNSTGLALLALQAPCTAILWWPVLQHVPDYVWIAAAPLAAVAVIFLIEKDDKQ
jgi:hypothetical protein